jgi:hypothetical protein
LLETLGLQPTPTLRAKEFCKFKRGHTNPGPHILEGVIVARSELAKGLNKEVRPGEYDLFETRSKIPTEVGTTIPWATALAMEASNAMRYGSVRLAPGWPGDKVVAEPTAAIVKPRARSSLLA